jgi:hypothetical protein
MRYWLGGRARAAAEGGVAQRGAADRYLSYEKWPGGFNNVRMSLEIAAALAFALNRTLVWSPADSIYLRGAGSMGEYYEPAELNPALRTVSFGDFAREVGLKGKGEGAFKQLRGRSDVKVAPRLSRLLLHAPAR